jgi:cell wall-associated NlpC family hydrolase
MTISRQLITPFIQASIITISLVCSSQSWAAPHSPAKKQQHAHHAHQKIQASGNTPITRKAAHQRKTSSLSKTLRNKPNTLSSKDNSNIPNNSGIAANNANTAFNAAASLPAYTPAAYTPVPNTEYTEYHANKNDDKLSELISRLAIQHDAAVHSQDGTIRGKLENLTQRASDLALHAMGMLGINYKRGGSDPETGLDCSGMVRYVFKQALGRDLPRSAIEISRVGEDVSVQDLQAGDLVFYNTMRRGFSHVGIYLGDGKFIHSPSAGGQVRIESMELAYWKKRFDGARRVPEVQKL